MDAVGEAIEERTGEGLGAEHLGPFVERQVGGHRDGAAFVTLAEDLEQQLGANLGQRHEAEFTDDQELVGGEPPLEPEELYVVARHHELMQADEPVARTPPAAGSGARGPSPSRSCSRR